MSKAVHLLRRRGAAVFVLMGLVVSGALPALAQNTAAGNAAVGNAAVGIVQVPHNWEINFQAPGSPVQARIEGLNWLIFWIIAAITIFVAGLLLYVIWRFRASVHPQPSRISHNTWLEVAWTLLPALVLVAIAIPSFRLVYYEDRTPNPDMTIKVTGHQWYWHYDYPDQGNVGFDSYMVADDDLKPGQFRHLSVDNPVVVPVGKKIRILQTSGDVIHSFFIPSLGVQRYAIPGRVIETWVEVRKPGTYYGECNQICGTNHSVMPIEVRAVMPQDFNAWVTDAKKKFAADATPVPPANGGTRLAAAVAH